jgi:hypothetical protein
MIVGERPDRIIQRICSSWPRHEFSARKSSQTPPTNGNRIDRRNSTTGQVLGARAAATSSCRASRVRFNTASCLVVTSERGGPVERQGPSMIRRKRNKTASAAIGRELWWYVMHLL